MSERIFTIEINQITSNINKLSMCKIVINSLETTYTSLVPLTVTNLHL